MTGKDFIKIYKKQTGLKTEDICRILGIKEHTFYTRMYRNGRLDFEEVCLLLEAVGAKMEITFPEIVIKGNTITL